MPLVQGQTATAWSVLSPDMPLVQGQTATAWRVLSHDLALVQGKSVYDQLQEIWTRRLPLNIQPLNVKLAGKELLELSKEAAAEVQALPTFASAAVCDDICRHPLETAPRPLQEVSRLVTAACAKASRTGLAVRERLLEEGYSEGPQPAQRKLDTWQGGQRDGRGLLTAGAASGLQHADSSRHGGRKRQRLVGGVGMPMPTFHCYFGRAVVPVDCSSEADIVAYLERLPRDAMPDHEARDRQAHAVYVVLHYSRSGQEVNMVENRCIRFNKETDANGGACRIPGAVCDNVANGTDSAMAYHKCVHTMHVVYFRLWTSVPGEWDDQSQRCKHKKACSDHEDRTDEERLAFVGNSSGARQQVPRPRDACRSCSAHGGTGRSGVPRAASRPGYQQAKSKALPQMRKANRGERRCAGASPQIPPT